jgi:hypothetical protein
MTYGFIIAAGNQSRFHSELPKALVPVGNSNIPLLYFNVKMMREYCDKVFVVCSITNRPYFDDYNNSGYGVVDLIEIESGIGCGDAVYKALNHIPFYNDFDRCYIQWGDSIQLKDTFDKLSSYATYRSVLLPCTIEDFPYVQIVPTASSVKVRFSKLGDKTERGYHDLSLFLCNCVDLKENMRDIVNQYYNGTNYDLRNNEFSFLDVFNYSYITAEIVDVGGVPANSFNSIEDLNKLCL